MVTYEIIKNMNDLTGMETQTIVRSDGAIIPMDEANSDYQEYLAWKAEQETAK